MGNVYPVSVNPKQGFGPLSAHDDEDGVDSGTSAALASLIAENTRLRALVVQLSDLVLRNVADTK